MKTKKILISGSSGLIGSEVVKYFSLKGYEVHGIDNNMREFFFGNQGNTRWNQNNLLKEYKSFNHHEIDIRDRNSILNLVKSLKPDVVVHTAAQPSHDKAADIPFEDFEVNALGTLNLLESCRRYCKESPFIHLSTNKVYGDRPNYIKMTEHETRWDFDDVIFLKGINESLSIDQSKHSLFGASKVAADIMVQEYGRYFNMPTCCLRGGCLTGPNHSGVELHGFISYLIKCNLEEKKYTVFGYKGKQVRDNIHSFDVVNFMNCFISSPRIGEVYNIGGGKDNSISMLEAFDLIQNISGIKMNWDYSDINRQGDHIVYYSDLTKIKSHYPSWAITKDLNTTFTEIFNNWQNRNK
jgi:CDP-paratose 2-epimerase